MRKERWVYHPFLRHRVLHGTRRSCLLALACAIMVWNVCRGRSSDGQEAVKKQVRRRFAIPFDAPCYPWNRAFVCHGSRLLLTESRLLSYGVVPPHTGQYLPVHGVALFWLDRAFPSLRWPLPSIRTRPPHAKSCLPLRERNYLQLIAPSFQASQLSPK